jgi:uncharacterized membrane protein YjgN (DUF898 family)
MAKSGRFRFDGGAATYIGTGILAALITICTFGICYPFALVLRERWRAKHSSIDGFPLVFTGSAWGLFGNWLKWLALSIITLGIYLFWVGPRIQEWKWEHTDFDRSRYPLPLTGVQQAQPFGYPTPPVPGRI